MKNASLSIWAIGLCAVGGWCMTQSVTWAAGAERSASPEAAVSASVQQAASTELPAPAAESAFAGPYTWFVFVRDAKLDERQQQHLASLLAQREAARAQWEELHGEAFSELRAQRAAAREAEDSEALGRLNEEMRAVRASRSAMDDEFEARIKGLLSDEQAARWDAGHLYNAVLRDLRRLELTEQQKKQIHELCLDIARDEERSLNRSRTTNIVYDQLLSEEQRETLRPDRSAEAS